MAPRIVDDFVLTLSDDDDVVPDDELEESEVDTVTELSNSHKRKRAEMKQSAVKKHKPDKEGGDEGILSDFEFDDGRAADLADFDGWETTGAGKDSISDIVDRRKGIRQHVVSDAALLTDDGSVEASEEDDLESEAEDEDENEESELNGKSNGKAGPTSQSDDEEGEDEDEDDESPTANGHGMDEADDSEDLAAPVAHPDDLASDVGSDAAEDAIERGKQAAFFAPAQADQPLINGDFSFGSMSLSRPIMRGLSELKFVSPTPIQRKAIPVALEGKDIVGGAVTGSGKTGAFIIPILERLLFRPKRVPTTRVAILMPTRELALQCLAVAKKLASHTDVTFGRAIGGLNAREQEKELKLRPDIVIATPGRFIDFMRNSPALQVDKIEILVLDEADRMLEEGFADELNEILNTIPKSRQTMLFSATMTSRVDDLVRVGLQRPVRLLVDAQKTSALGLTQEFVRLRPGRESSRLGYLMYLCSEVHRDRVIIFFRQKKDAHRIRVVFALCGLKAAELHGSMSQEQRINSMEAFRSGRASFLLATDLASRGLDIKGIETVINYEAPQSHEIYLHRVGRTARAGRKGISCTLAAEPDRRVVKAAVKAAKAQSGAQIRQRTVDPKDADTWQRRCGDLETDIEDVLREEKEEKVLQQTERTIVKAENIEKYGDEIAARPKKTWFQSEKEKVAAKAKGGVVLNGESGGTGKESGKKKPKTGKLSNKQKKRLEDKDDRKAGLEWKKTKGSEQRAKTKPGAKPGAGGKPGSKFGASGKPSAKTSTGEKPGVNSAADGKPASKPRAVGKPSAKTGGSGKPSARPGAGGKPGMKLNAGGKPGTKPGAGGKPKRT
ncbi:nucleolar DEAD-box protein required for synthesis of 60S ribosomal subunit [Friedmanniomyces endolithicus]|nr:nucleolar DEAD-box protein required for synthesis of 60S ribosomal subunit [Friedmanniomyces endolithicus]KAK0769369.1 nucleolar DEAD-box protein required for synthesis of 60S ribosomal subunit [Friedmanniomyces endolithicus]KAK0770051.1 nucleolar DEAD-box protein required for synthesis of 60S ribosomal subunit [Friedmanniomyces endolithicus]KAK0771328.1 nucleolar DEAD-box protein required for synthesis of 60S ribosomal subunit [Friedmanniomyces endolithicus]